MRIPPFYSFLRGAALEDVWHDNDECGIGNTIALADRIAGKDDIHTRCRFCALLDQLIAVPVRKPLAPTN